MGNKLSCIRPDVAEFPPRGSIGLKPKFPATISTGKENREIYSKEERQKIISRLQENNKRYDYESEFNTKLFGLPDMIGVVRLLSGGPETEEIFIELKDKERLNRLHKAFCEGPIETRAKRVIPRSLCLRLDVESAKVKNIVEGHSAFEFSFAEFQCKVTSFLKTCGKQIWYFRYVLHSFLIPSSMGVSENQVYSDLFSWVSLMPNLKRLELDFRGLLPNEAGALPLSFPPFPHLPQLERIAIGRFSKEFLRKELVLSAISSNLQIKYLKLNGLDEGSETDFLFLIEMEPFLPVLNLMDGPE